jgi:isopenicillin N synthase-like dioxygenase
MSRDAELPIIDITDFYAGSITQKKRIAAEVTKACSTSGFFYLSGHGIPRSLFNQARKVAIEFFTGPQERKSEVHISKVSHHRGYVGHYDVAPDTVKGGDIREAFKVALELDQSDPDYQAGITLYGPNVWPRNMPGFQSVIYQTYTHFLELSQIIFRLFALGLELPEDYFKPLSDKPASVMNVNYYPASRTDNSSGIGAHSDYEAFAMLWQDDIGGLEIESLNGQWQSVKPVPDALVINIGDLMSRWTNDRFRATRHRVFNTSGKERVSIACFGNTNYHALIECIPACYSKDNPARYPPVIAGEYLMEKIKGTYAYAQD